MRHPAQHCIRVSGAVLVCIVVLGMLAAGQQSETECDVMLKGGPGTLIHAVQLQQLSNDSKRFVDMPIKQGHTVKQLLAAFQQLPTQATAGSTSLPSKEDLQQLVAQYFDEPGSDLVEVTPPDMSPDPPHWIAQLATENETLSNFTAQVYQLWRLLYRKEAASVAEDPSRHTLLPLPHAFVIAGDRFRELYYWDSYWVIRGLMACGMHRTARDMVLDFLHQVDTVGHVPNGARCYYINRSQPPLLSAMVMVTARLQPAGPGSTAPPSDSAHVDKDLLQRALPRLLTEWQYWTSGSKAVLVAAQDGSSHQLSRYWADWYAPRPESYREDWQLAAQKLQLNGSDLQHSSAARQLWHDLASAAESGWDFSSRWLEDPQDLSSIRTTQIIPADLNAFLAQMAQNIASIASFLGNHTLHTEYAAIAAQRWQSLNTLMWNTCTGSWHDLLITQQQQQQQQQQQRPASPSCGSTSSDNSRGHGPVHVRVKQQPGPAVASNWVPLWAGAAAPGSQLAAQAVTGLQNSGLLQVGGVLTSLLQTGQQWDAPNAWPPLQHMIIEGLAHAGVVGSDALAKKLAGAWLGSAEAAYWRDKVMHEKYNAFTPGIYGAGGEYKPQVGFGWTNGAVLDLLHQGYRPSQS